MGVPQHGVLALNSQDRQTGSQSQTVTVKHSYVRTRDPSHSPSVCVKPACAVLRYGNCLEDVAELPKHPDHKHEGHVLSEEVAGLVLVDMPVCPPDESPDTSCVYHTSAIDHNGVVFAHAVWFTPLTAQAVARDRSGLSLSLEDSVHDLCDLWQADGGGSEGLYVAGVQHAAGKYSELGSGILPGTGRTSIEVDGRRCCLPYYRNQTESDRFEEPLAMILGPVYAVVRLALPSELIAAHDAQYASFSPEVMRIASA